MKESNHKETEFIMINIPEILVANGTGAFLVLFLLLYRIRIAQTNQFDEKAYNFMLVITFIATINETLSFIIDARPGFIFQILQYISNTIASASSGIIGYSWCLFVEYHIHRNFKRIKKKSKILAIPLIIAMILLIINLCGTSIIFDISKQNKYTRGPVNFLLYIIVFIYYIESIYTVQKAKNDSILVEFFPIYYFIIPCMIGTMIQGFFFGISTIWLCVAIAFIIVYIEIQISISFIDDLSGLYNRKFMNHYLNKLQNDKIKHVYGFLLDINEFKSINDTYGHITGDHALIQFGRILQHSIDKDSVAIRMGGDEFVVFANLQSDDDALALKKRIEYNIRQFNIKTDEPFHLYFSIGIAKYNGNSIDSFLSAMDDSMYEAKKMHHLMQ
ncbi:GGDEF domain-containing protein [uncultured Holdemanella sp.]|mgnify:FL=1|uniref:GGDEF domain-containing protein n=1 Tax=uncultured Holdemanella sp. TaxID=1763549 RepID=UPI00265A3410|nr:GGDEF domain-containing protein [uncultured Holdemanella sp.]